MSVVVLTSAGGAPGVTTTALGLALAWPRPVLLVDADRTPTQAMLAGYLRGEHPGHRGFGRLLQASREGRPMGEVLDAETIELPALLATGNPPARFLPGFPHPGMVGLFGASWPELMAALAGWPGDVLIDAGRIGAEGLPSPLTQRADLVLTVTRTSLVALAGLRLYLGGVRESASDTALLLVGNGMPYGRAEVQQQFAMTIAAEVAHAPAQAAVLSDGAPVPRRFADSAYFRGVRQAAGSIAGRLEATRELIGARR